MNSIKLLAGYIPGAIGRVAGLHGIYYSRYWDFGLFFEVKVATELSEFLCRFDKTRDGFWVAENDGKIAGSVSIDGIECKTKGARLRWFIVDPEFHGRGIGRMLMKEAIEFCKTSNHRKIYLTAFVGSETMGFFIAMQKSCCLWCN